MIDCCRLRWRTAAAEQSTLTLLVPPRTPGTGTTKKLLVCGENRGQVCKSDPHHQVIHTTMSPGWRSRIPGWISRFVDNRSSAQSTNIQRSG
jgi:hypothetical protein